MTVGVAYIITAAWNDGESRMTFKRIDESTIRCIVTEEDMAENGLELDDFFTQSDKAQDFLRELAYRDKLYEYGLEPMNRILMYGASGCGKTYLSKAL